MGVEKKKAKDLHSNRRKLWDKSMLTHQKYIDNKTGLFCKQFLENRNCPVCDASDDRFLFNKAGGTYVMCNKCKMMYLNPVFSDHELSSYYSNNHAVQAELVSEDLEFYNSIYQKGLNLSEKFISKSDNLLDVGCSSGIFLDLAKANGWKNCVGVELNENEAAIGEKKGHNIYTSLIDDVNFECKFQLITLWDVFEHIKNGKEYLLKFKSLLDRTGLVFLQIPNAMSLAARVMQSESNMFDGLEHVNLYSTKTIRDLAEVCGYEILALNTVISEINVLNNYVNFENGYSGNQPSAEEILGEINEDFVYRNKLGYKIQVIMRHVQ